ncbi:hypothetical protein RTCIAT899_PB00020 (plasmid) [Rhizobium tropici CIAT 899]|uniref:Uncharacterized protein n=2 Tax=Rhizobium TaxID=379 RepID=A0A6P1CCI6_RHITR|nr:hypothetical protein RTCIAT899_PB00020 [Rhizobium tropici CIAT 899]AYG76660.1 hypothetical protein CCGE532_29300 [Rhizobium sp. CCGE532]NEV14557.1 hypothetical protein [Rhizobium tropici]TGE91282.1 hypothetical protein C9417_28570 [Rhizobium sp. SEMIA 4088]
MAKTQGNRLFRKRSLRLRLFDEVLTPRGGRGGEELDRFSTRYFRSIRQNFQRPKMKSPQGARICGFSANSHGQIRYLLPPKTITYRYAVLIGSDCPSTAPSRVTEAMA